jgi:predicted secreted protein
LEVHEVHLRKGEIYKINLGGLGSAGYVWTYTIESSSDIINVTTEQVETLPVPSHPEKIPYTSNTDTMFIIKAIKTGNTKIIFNLKRPWEKTKPPLKEITLDLTISQ